MRAVMTHLGVTRLIDTPAGSLRESALGLVAQGKVPTNWIILTDLPGLVCLGSSYDDCCLVTRG